MEIVWAEDPAVSIAAAWSVRTADGLAGLVAESAIRSSASPPSPSCVKALDEAPQPVTTDRLWCWPIGSGSLVSATSRSPIVVPTPDPQSRGELTTQLAVACLGAGVITSVAVAQGQNPLTALGITLFSAIAAVAVGQVL